MSEDEFGDIPDEFAGMDGVDWGTLLAAGPSTTGPVQEVTQAGGQAQTSTIDRAELSPSSSIYFDEVVMDSAFLAELDAVEHRITQGASHLTSEIRPGTGSGAGLLSHTRASATNYVSRIRSVVGSGFQDSHNFNNETPHRGITSNARHQVACQIRDEEQGSTATSKRPRSEPLSPRLPKKKGKMKAVNDGDIRQILLGFEDELLCPVCCDIIVAAQVGNPCGHSFCGDCGWQWTVATKKKGCPICRTELSKNAKMIPNISLDNMIEKYITALGSAGNDDWNVGGKCYNEWVARKEKWKAEAGERAKEARHQAPRKAVIDLTFFEMAPWVDYDNDADPTYAEEEDFDGAGPIIPGAPRPRRTRTFRG